MLCFTLTQACYIHRVLATSRSFLALDVFPALRALWYAHETNSGAFLTAMLGQVLGLVYSLDLPDHFGRLTHYHTPVRHILGHY